jgi:hypothetical protein
MRLSAGLRALWLLGHRAFKHPDFITDIAEGTIIN